MSRSREFRFRWSYAALVLLAAFAFQAPFLPMFTTDVSVDFVSWFNTAVRAGPVAVFAHPWASYSPPYLYALALMTPAKGLLPDPYLIKLLSFAGAVALAAATRRLLRALAVPDADPIALCVLALPSVGLNTALMGQADAWACAPLVAAAAAAVERRHRAMLVWAGVALSIKLQAILFAPFLLGVLLGRRVPVRWWLCAPAAYVAMFLPAWALGWPASDLAGIYFRQAQETPALSRNSPNLWAIAQTLGITDLRLTGPAIGVALAASGALAAWLAVRVRSLAPVDVMRAALLAPLLAAGLLPRMHERYFFVADVLSLALAATARDRESWQVAGLVQLGSLAGIFAFATGVADLAALGGVLMVTATVLVAHRLLAPWWPRAQLGVLGRPQRVISRS